jgi:hypothetical protein
MDWVFYIICGLIVLLAVFIVIREIRKMAQGKCCENCKNCAMRSQCDGKSDNNDKTK